MTPTAQPVAPAAEAPIIDLKKATLKGKPSKASLKKKASTKDLSKDTNAAPVKKTLAEVPQQDSQLTVAAPESDTMGDGSRKNAYMESVGKRLRTLRKRLTKLETYSSADPLSLQKDQKEALEKLPEVSTTVKELEDLMKQMTVTETEETKANKELERQRELETRQKVNNAVEEVKQSSAAHLDNLFKTLVTFNSCLPTLLTTTPIGPWLNLSQEQIMAAEAFGKIVAGMGFDNAVAATLVDNVKSAQHHLQLYLNKSSEEFVNGVSYAGLNDVAAIIMNPPQPPKFGTVDTEAPVVASETEQEEETVVVKPSAGIKFGFSTNEVMEQPTEMPQQMYTEEQVIEMMQAQQAQAQAQAQAQQLQQPSPYEHITHPEVTMPNPQEDTIPEEDQSVEIILDNPAAEQPASANAEKQKRPFNPKRSNRGGYRGNYYRKGPRPQGDGQQQQQQEQGGEAPQQRQGGRGGYRGRRGPRPQRDQQQQPQQQQQQ